MVAIQKGNMVNEKVPSVEPEGPGAVQAGYLGVAPPLGNLPQRGERRWVDRPEQLLQAVDVLKRSHVIAIDAEFTQSRPRVQAQSASSTSAPRLALLQLAIDGHCYVVDALRLADLSPLSPIVENPEHAILLHGAGADLRVMAQRGLNVAHYYDLEAISRSLFGQNESSLATMLMRAFNYRMDKSLQRTDWTRRPLPPAMIAYAARDAEMTLALYYWLKQHFPWTFQLYEYPARPEPIAPWIEPLLRSTSPIPSETVVAEAIEKGEILNMEQVYADCRAALTTLINPVRRSRLLRLIADLSLMQLIPEIEPLLQAPTSEERAAAARALSRLAGEQGKALIRPLLQDPVQDVRKAIHALLSGSREKDRRGPGASLTRNADGTRSWSVGDTSSSDDDSDWKARLRSIMGE